MKDVVVLAQRSSQKYIFVCQLYQASSFLSQSHYRIFCIIAEEREVDADPSASAMLRSVQASRVKVDDVGKCVTVQREAHGQQGTLTFRYDGVFTTESQESVYNTVAAGAVEQALDGVNASVIAYGQTGSGKTYTMSGDAASFKRRGIIPRALKRIFKEKDLRPDLRMRVVLTSYEIYNDVLHDLLAEDSTRASELSVREDASAISIKGLSERVVETEEEALECFFEAQEARAKTEHVLNRNSSRSHCIFTVHLHISRGADSNDQATISKLNLVDLAGSERTKKTQSSGAVLKEASYINRSLTFLEQTVNSLARSGGDRSKVSFRQTKLTEVLKDALGGNCKTVMVANVWLLERFLEETMTTLRFGSRIRNISTVASVNEPSDAESLARKYERQIKELKQELAMRETLAGRGADLQQDDPSETEVAEQRQLAIDFLNGEIDTDALPLHSIIRIKSLFRTIRDVHNEHKVRSATLPPDWNIRKQASSTSPQDDRQQQLSTNNNNNNSSQLPSGTSENNDGLVGEYEDVQGVNVGQAPADAAPEHSDTRSANAQNSNNRTDAGSSQETSPHTAPPQSEQSHRGGRVNAEREEAYERFKVEVAPAAFNELQRKRTKLKELRKQLRDKAVIANAAKREIDTLTQEVQKRSASASGGQTGAEFDADVNDAEQKLREKKSEYKQAHDNLRQLRAETEPLENEAEAARQSLLDHFEQWFESAGFETHAQSTAEPSATGTTRDAEVAQALQEPAPTDPFVSAKRKYKKQTVKPSTLTKRIMT